MTPETLISQLESLKGDRDHLINCLKSVIRSSFVEEFQEGTERPCEEHDFTEKKLFRESQIDKVKCIIQELVNCGYFNVNREGKINHSHPDIDNELLALILILCGENIHIHPWNNKTIVMNCEIILSEILKVFACNNVTDLISRNHKISLIKSLLQIKCPNLLPTTWRHFPASVVCYKWILEKIKQPELSSHLPMVLPTALLLVDDFVNENKIIGVECLNHIIQNVTIAELQFCGHGDVIYNALIPLLRIREANLISSTIPCLVCLTTKLEIDFGKKNVTQWSKFDSILEIYLENMEMEHLVDLRNAFISNLSLLLSASGNGVIRWSKRLLRIFNEYLEIAGKHNDSRAENYCLKAIETYIQVSKPLISLYAKSLLYSLLIVLNSKGESAMVIENKEIMIRCVKTIWESTPESDKEDIRMELKKHFSSDKYYSQFYQQVCSVLQI